MIIKIRFKELAEKPGEILNIHPYTIFYEHKKFLDSLVKAVFAENEEMYNFTEEAKATFKEAHDILIGIISDLNIKTNKRLENEVFRLLLPEEREIADMLLITGLDAISKACVLTNESWFGDIETDKEFEEYYLDNTELEEIPFLEYVESLVFLTILLEKGIEKCNAKNKKKEASKAIETLTELKAELEKLGVKFGE